MEVIDILGRSELFGSFEKKYLEKIVPLCRSQHYSMGETIFNEESESKDFYILTDGNLALEKKVKQAFENRTLVTRLEEIGKGEAFGWSGLIEPHTFSASVRCLTDCEVLCINCESLRELMDSDPNLGYELVQRLARLISSRMTYARDNLTRSLSQVHLAQEI
ncbi:cyclic nucleotide-binding domain-containing protein [Chloroflexota bacterium]